jgi:hypothetical protein
MADWVALPIEIKDAEHPSGRVANLALDLVDWAVVTVSRERTGKFVEHDVSLHRASS